MKKLTLEQIEKLRISNDGLRAFWGWVKYSAIRSPEIQNEIEAFANFKIKGTNNQDYFTTPHQVPEL